MLCHPGPVWLLGNSSILFSDFFRSAYVTLKFIAAANGFMRVRNIFNIVYIREAVKNIQLLSMWQAYTHCDNLYIVDNS